MRILITLEATTAWLPVNYQSMCRSMIYKTIGNDFPELHDHYRSYFTFNRLNGQSEYDARSKRLLFKGELTWTVSFLEDRHAEVFVNRLVERGEFQIGTELFLLKAIHQVPAEEMEQTPRVRLLAPAVSQVMIGKKTHYFTPDDPAFLIQLEENAKHKYATYFGKPYDGELRITLRPGRTRKNVTRDQGTLVTGWTVPLSLEASREMAQFLYRIGLGARNASGHGMFEFQ